MSSSTDRLRRSSAASLAPLAAITLLGAALRLPEIGQTVYADEMWSYAAATSSSLGAVLDFVHSDQEITPPLYPILAWLSAKLGDPSVLIRLPVVVAGIATIPLIYAIGTRTLGRNVAILAALVASLSPFLAFYSVEARAYSLAVAFVATSTLCMLVALERGSVRWWAGYALASAAAMYSHYTSAYVLAAQLGWLLWFHRGSWRQALAANTIAALAFVPWIPGVAEDFGSPSQDVYSLLAPFNLDNFVSFTGSWALGHPANGLRTFWGTGVEAALLVGVAVGLVGLILQLRSDIPAAARPDGGSVALVCVLAAAAPLGAAAVSLIGDDMYFPRNLATSWPGWSIALAALLLAGRGGVRVVAVALVVGACAVGAVRTTGADQGRPDVEGAATFIQANADPGDVVLDVVFPGSGPDVPVSRTLEINLVESLTTIDVAGPADVRRGLEAAAGGRLLLVGLPAAVDPIRSVLPAGNRPVLERTFPGLVETTVLAYDVPASARG